MKERQILFKGEMVRAILSGQKTQTRRILKPQIEPFGRDGKGFKWAGKKPNSKYGEWTTSGDLSDPRDLKLFMSEACPNGKAGDRLWVRETFALEQQVESDQKPPHDDGRPIKYEGEFDNEWVQPHYRATDKTPELGYDDMPEDVDHMCRWKPSIFMPRWASRINLEIVSVRVDRLQGISRGDAMAEGCPFPNIAKETDPKQWYRDLWEQINGAGSWDLNPWVWVIEFKRVAQ